MGDTPTLAPAEPTSAAAAKHAVTTARLWPVACMVAAYWALRAALWLHDGPIQFTFFSTVISGAVLILLFLVWWSAFSRFSGKDRLLGIAALIGTGIVAGLLSDKSMLPFGLPMYLPVVLSGWAVWLLVAQKASPAVQRVGLLLTLILAWGYNGLLRMDGVDGSAGMTLHWRWNPKAEQLYLAELAKAAKKSANAANPAVARNLPKNDAAAQTPRDTQPDASDPSITPEQLSSLSMPDEMPAPLRLQAGDWPEFRGSQRDGVLHDMKIATDWNVAAPTQVWRQRIGPAWSSVAVVGDRIFTQEQRADSEAVVCLDAASGHEIWAHQDNARFEEPVAGAGPRATPTFAAGCIYALGAKGGLNCLDAATGIVKWSRDIVKDSGAKIPMWGFSSSPLVVDGIVIVYAGAEPPAGGDSGNKDGEKKDDAEKDRLSKDTKGLLAYHAETGDLLWTVATGKLSYSSPQLVSIERTPQVLFMCERGLTACDPQSGRVLWEFAARSLHNWRAIQPRQVGDGAILFGSEDLGLVLIDVAASKNETGWVAAERWKSRDMKPAYNDVVVHEGYAYGFDGAIFCCVDLSTGKRRWKQGRYGHGQVLLLADQPALLVTSEKGEAILIAPNPDKLEELGRFQAVNGKTWNHPVIAHGRLYVRNDEEMACYDVHPL